MRNYPFDTAMTIENKIENRVTIRLTPEIKQKLENFCKKNGFLQTSAAIRYLIVKALDAEEKPVYLVRQP